MFQVRLYRFSLSNNQAYNNNTNINNVPNHRLQHDFSNSQCNGLPPYSTQFNTFGTSQRGNLEESGWNDSQRSLIQGDGYQNYGHIYNDSRISMGTQRRYWSNTNSPVTPTNPFPSRAFRIAENAPRGTKSFPKPLITRYRMIIVLINVYATNATIHPFFETLNCKAPDKVLTSSISVSENYSHYYQSHSNS